MNQVILMLMHLFVCVFFFFGGGGYRLYNHIQLSSNLMSGCDYSLFKVGMLFVSVHIHF